MSKQRKYLRLKDFRLGSVFRRLFGHAAGTASGDAHKRIRNAFDGCYSANSVAQTVSMMENECKQYLTHIVQDNKVRKYVIFPLDSWGSCVRYGRFGTGNLSFSDSLLLVFSTSNQPSVLSSILSPFNRFLSISFTISREFLPWTI